MPGCGLPVSGFIADVVLKGTEREKFWKQKEDLMKDKEAYESSVIRQPSKHRPKKPTQQDRINVLEARNKIARIRKAGEQIDPRVKKRKTVRPDSPVQRVAYNPPDRPKTHPTESLSREMDLVTKSKSKLPLKKRVELLRGKKTKPVAESSVINKKSHPSGGGFLLSDLESSILRKTPSRGSSTSSRLLGHSRGLEGIKGKYMTKEYVEKNKLAQTKDRIAELKTAKEHSHSIAFRKHEGQYYRRASLQKQEGKYAKYWLLNAKTTNGNGWGVSPTSIAKNINKFIGRPFVVTAKQWIPESEYGEQFEHPYLPTNNIDNIISHQEKFRVGSIVDVVEKDGDYHAVIEINSKFANMMLPPFCSPAIFQNNPGEADGEISDWEALHLAGLMEDPAYGARIALLKGSCMGTAEACSIQFKAAKQTTMCPKKKAKLVRRIDRLGD